MLWQRPKTKILEKYEQSAKSENFATASNISSHNSEHESESHNPIKGTTLNLNPKEQVFEPRINILDNKVHQSSSMKDPRKGYSTRNTGVSKMPTIDFHYNKTQPRKIYNPQRTILSDTYIVDKSESLEEDEDNDINNNNDVSYAIVKSLRKPAPDIKKFGGDPLEFRKFVRQFTAKITANSDTDDEKMTYLEQFTYGEASKVVQGYSHLDGRHAFKSAMNQLEERYGDVEVIASAFIKRALDWPNIKPGDSKAHDQYALFLIECQNAANSIDARRILEYSENIRQLMRKLPFHLHDRWRSIVLRTKANKQTVQIVRQICRG